MTYESVLSQLGYTPNEALADQLGRIEKNTREYDRIIKHILELHESLKVDDSYIAMSNSNDYFKIKIDTPATANADSALEKINHFSEKYKVELEKVAGKPTYYIIGYSK